MKDTITNVLLNYAKKFAVDNGEECAYRLVEAFDQDMELWH
jgi:hypothetical protein